MEEFNCQYYSEQNKSLSSNIHPEIVIPISNFNTFNIHSIGNESNNSDNESNNPNQGQKNTNNILFQAKNSNNSNENNQNQDMLKYSPSNISIKSQEQNDIKENLVQNSSLKEIEIENENENSESNIPFQTGRWTKEEHQKFIEGILNYGNEWKKVQKIIKTRSSTQARSHAQKFFLRIRKEVNLEILSDTEKLLNYIVNSSGKKHILTKDEKEKLLTVIRSNLKAEESSNKSGKEGNNFSINLKEKEDSNFGDDNEEEDNLAYNKGEMFDFKEKKSFDVNDAKRKITFCSRKRKSSSNLSCISNYNKIFNISKDISHKNSMDIPKNNDLINNNLGLKNSAKKNINNNNKKIKFNIKNNNNNNFIINKNIDNNNYKTNKNINNKKGQNNNTNVFIQNNFINIINSNNINNFNDLNINNSINNHQNIQKAFNNQFNTNYHNLKNEQKNSFPKHIFNTFQINPPTDFNKNNNFYIINNPNFFPNYNKIENQVYNNKPNDIEQTNPFNINFEKIASNDMKRKEEFPNYYVSEVFDNDKGDHTISDICNNLYDNQ